jgi:hypothetical protein
MLLVSTTLSIAFRSDGQLPFVVSVKAVILFVVSGAGFIPSNFNAETSDSKLSGRIVPMIELFSDQPFASAAMNRC